MDILNLLRNNRMQKGELIETPTAFFARYYISESYANGRRKTKCEKLAERSDIYRSKKDVQPLFDAAMARVNGKQERSATAQMSLSDYFDGHYLPWVEMNKAAATVNGYKQVWFKYLKPHVGKIALANLRTVQVTKLLDHHAHSGLGRYTLSHIKFVLSGIFVYAVKTGVVPTNPVEKAGYTVSVARPKKQVRYSLQAVLAMLRVLEPIDLQAAVAVGLAYFAALRPAEIRGLQWGDYDGTVLNIQRAMWRNKLGKTKTEGSAANVFVIEPIKSLLEKLKAETPNGTDKYILQSSRGTALSLDALNGRVITPALEKAEIEWCGYYACRRGISSKITDVSKNPLNSTGLLRHSDSTTALQFYTEPQEDSIRGAMRTVEAEAAQIALQILEKE
jgi:integrase